ncbi:MAG: hypothetical protein Q9178_003014 [Gyalolechia marmorata]
MADQKQVIDLKGLGGYIRPEKLEELLAQKYGRKIEVTFYQREKKSGATIID